MLQFTYLAISADRAAMAVLAGWALLAIGGRWRPEGGWLDRSGINLGIFWVLRSLLEFAVGFVTFERLWG